jgi:hypothetical protein
MQQLDSMGDTFRRGTRTIRELIYVRLKPSLAQNTHLAHHPLLKSVQPSDLLCLRIQLLDVSNTHVTVFTFSYNVKEYIGLPSSDR